MIVRICFNQEPEDDLSNVCGAANRTQSRRSLTANLDPLFKYRK